MHGLLRKALVVFSLAGLNFLHAEVNPVPVAIRILGDLSHRAAPKSALPVLGTDKKSLPPAVTKTSRILFYGKSTGTEPAKFIITVEDENNSSPYLEVDVATISQMTGIPAENFADENEASILNVSEMTRLNKLQVAEEAPVAIVVPEPVPADDGKCEVALTFDDGPHGTLTPRLMKYLKGQDVPATFFLLAQNANEYPQIMKTMLDTRGTNQQPLFFMANHSHSHPNLVAVKGAEKLKKEITSLESNAHFQAALKQQNGQKFFRCPYGNHNHRVDEAIAGAGYKSGHVDWDIDPLDWKVKNAKRVSDKVINDVNRICRDPEARKKGVIVLLHDIHATSVDAAEIIVRQLKDKVKFVTIDQINPQNTAFKGLKKDQMHGE